MLAGRELSETRLKTRLTERGHTPAAVAHAAARLHQSGALDDLRAARACARTLVLVKLHGRLRARRELERLGFEKALAAQVLDEILDPVAEQTLLTKMLLRHARGRNEALGDPTVFRRVQSALVRRGFSPAQVRASMLRRLRGSAPEELEPPFDAWED
jgi:SOS response regulatory protein OraA/RecX